MRIPRLIHRIWLGSEPMPPLYEHFGHTWQRHHPGWELRLWTDDALPELAHPDAYARARNDDERLDVLRYELLHRFGGVCAGTDVECRRSLEPLIGDAAAFAAWTRAGTVGSAVVGAVAGHPAMEAALTEAERSAGRGSQPGATGTVLLTRVLLESPDAVIFDPGTFYPFDRADLPLATRDFPDAYAVHHLDWSWTPSDLLELRNRRLRTRLKESERQVRRARREARRARTALAGAERRLGAIEGHAWWGLGRRVRSRLGFARPLARRLRALRRGGARGGPAGTPPPPLPGEQRGDGSRAQLSVAYVVNAKIPVFGHKGEAAHVQGVVRALSRQGARVHLLAERLGGRRPVDLDSVAVHRLARTHGGRDRAERERTALASNDTLRERLEGIPDVDLVYERYTLWSYAAMEWARDRGIPALLEVNGARVEEATMQGTLIDRAGAERVAERAVGAASALIAVSEGVADHLRRRFDAGDRVHVIPNGVDPERFPERLLEERAQGERPFTVGYVGGFRPYHGLETLVEAFALLRERHPEAQLRLVGEGNVSDEVALRIERLGIAEAVLLPGALQPHEVPAQLAQMDVGVAPYAVSHASYASPLKVLEYFASGIPAVGSGVEQHGDLIREGETGFTFESGDAGSLAELLDRLARDASLREGLGRAGRELVLARYTWDAVAERILELAGAPAARVPVRA